jgi:hypothetical protein
MEVSLSSRQSLFKSANSSKSDTAQPPEKSALDFGWGDQNGLSPVYFVGQTSSDFLKDLLCTCITEVLEFF